MAFPSDLAPDWSVLQEQVLQELHSDVLPTTENKWLEFQSRLLAKLRQPHRPATEEEWQAFRHQILSQMLIRPWLDAKGVNLIPAGQWEAFIKTLPERLRPVTWREIHHDVLILKSQFKKRIMPGKPPPEPMFDFLTYDIPLCHPMDFRELRWQLHEKQFIWKVEAYLQPMILNKKVLDPGLRPDLLQAVQCGSEAEKAAEKLWRARIYVRLPGQLQPTDTSEESNDEWMRLDCLVLAQMPLKPRLDFDGKLTPEWRAKEEEWAEWQKLTALKLLNRYEVANEQWDAERYANSHIDGYASRSNDRDYPDPDIIERHEYREWQKRIYIQLPLSLRPPTIQTVEWFPLRHKAQQAPLTEGVGWQTLMRECSKVKQARKPPPPEEEIRPMTPEPIPSWQIPFLLGSGVPQALPY